MEKGELFENRIAEYNEIHQSAIKYIELFMRHEEQEMRLLAKFLIERNDINPYSFLPKHWANSTSTAHGMGSLLQNIEHSLYDDGDISFITINEEPRIVFCGRGELTVSRVLSETYIDLNLLGDVVDIKILPTATAFVEAMTKYHSEFILRSFILDAAMLSLAQADAIASEYQSYDPAWKTDPEILSKIEQKRKFFEARRNYARTQNET